MLLEGDALERFSKVALAASGPKRMEQLLARGCTALTALNGMLEVAPDFSFKA